MKNKEFEEDIKEFNRIIVEIGGGGPGILKVEEEIYLGNRVVEFSPRNTFLEERVL